MWILRVVMLLALFCSQLASAEEATAPLPSVPTDATSTLERKVEALEQKVKQFGERAEASSSGVKSDEIVLKSSSGDLTLQLNGILQADGRLFLNDDAHALTDTLTTRTIRPIFSGTYANLLRWQFSPDFAAGVATIQDAWVDLQLSDRVTIRVGKMTVPFGLERSQGTAALRFVERAFPTQLAPNRDVGVLVFGESPDKRLGWAVGGFDGAIDNGLTDTDNNDSKELLGRVYVRPFGKQQNDWLSSLLLGAAVTWGEQNGTDASPATPSWKSPGQNTFYTFRNGEKGKDASGAPIPLPNPVANGARVRWTAHVWWAGGPIALLGEYIGVNEPISRPGVNGATPTRGEWNASAWQGALSYVVGGKPSFSGTKIDTPFHVGAPGWGAFEVAARASGISAEAPTSVVYTDPSKSARQAISVTGGVRWHLSEHYRLFLDYEHTVFGGGSATGDRATEQAVLGRIQLAY